VELEEGVRRPYRYPTGKGEAKRKSNCRLGIRARVVRDCEGKRVVK